MTWALLAALGCPRGNPVVLPADTGDTDTDTDTDPTATPPVTGDLGNCTFATVDPTSGSFSMTLQSLLPSSGVFAGTSAWTASSTNSPSFVYADVGTWSGNELPDGDIEGTASGTYSPMKGITFDYTVTFRVSPP